MALAAENAGFLRQAIAAKSRLSTASFRSRFWVISGLPTIREPVGEKSVSRTKPHLVDGVHVISCWGKGAVSIPIYVHANRSLSPLGADLGPSLVRRRFCHKGDRQELPRYARFQRLSLRQHVPSRVC